MPAGRPTDFTKELGDLICEKLAEGKSLRTVCREEGMPDAASVFRWLRTHKEFCEQYTRSKEESADAQHEDLLDIGDESIQKSQEVDFRAASAVVQAYKLKADNLKWSMSKMKPKKYGDKMDVTSGDKPIPLLDVFGSIRNEKDSQSK